jgi:hypothetical protein
VGREEPVKVPTARYEHGKRWLAVWTTPDGQEATRAFAKKSDADLHSAAREADAARGTYIDPKSARIRVERWCETWLPATRRGGRPRCARPGCM